MMNRYIFAIFILLSCFLFTGCWNYREIDSIYIIAGIAIDKVADREEYNVATEFVSIKENQRGEGFESVILETKGESIADAVTKMIRVSAKQPYWGHTTSIIIGEEVAREGIMPFLDLFSRSGEARLGTNVYIAQGKSAKEVLTREGLSTDVKSYELSIMVNETKYLVKVPLLKVHEIINDLAIPKIHIVLPTIKAYDNDGKITNLLSGGGVFSQGRLVGFLDDKDMLAYLFIKDMVKAGVLNIKTGIENPQDVIILQILDSDTKIKPIYGYETIGFDISIKTDTAIWELTTMTDYISPEGRKKLKELAEKSLEKEIKDHIKDVRKEFGFDIFGFGNIIRQRNNKLWRNIEDDWDSIFMDTDINVNCDIEIRNSGDSSKPIKVVD